MRDFEHRIKKFLTRTHSLSTVEFFFEENEIKDEIERMKNQVASMSNYMPKVKLRMEDQAETIK